MRKSSPIDSSFRYCMHFIFRESIGVTLRTPLKRENWRVAVLHTLQLYVEAYIQFDGSTSFGTNWIVSIEKYICDR